MKKRYVLLATSLIAVSNLIGVKPLSANNKEGIRFGVRGLSESEIYNNICPKVGGVVDLTLLESETNMLNPQYVDDTKNGIVTLSKYFDYKLRAESWYTIAILSNGLYQAYENDATGYGFSFEFTNAEGDFYNYEAERDGVLNDIANNGNNYLQFYCAPYTNYETAAIYIAFKTPSSSNGYVNLVNFSYESDSSGTYPSPGIASMWFGDLEDDPGIEPYCGPSCNIEQATEGSFTGPYINGSVFPLSIPYGSSFSLNDMYGSLIAYDTGDDCFVSVELEEDNYSSQKEVINTPLDVVFSAIDSSNNKSTFTFRITLVDDVKPVISVIDTTKEISYKTQLNDQVLLENFAISDNYSRGVKEVKIKNCDYSSLGTFIGTFESDVEATDYSNNVTTINSSVEIVDDVAPVITGPDEVNLNANDPYSRERFLSLFTAVDEIDGEVEMYYVFDDYFENATKKGVYDVAIQAKDSHNNIVEFRIRVYVDDTDGPVFYVKESTITTTSNKPLSPMKILESLVRQNVLPNKNYINAEIVEGDYGYKSKVEFGTYEIKLLATAEDGSSELVNVTINVIEETQELNFWQKVLVFFKGIFDKISSFFKGLFAF